MGIVTDMDMNTMQEATDMRSPGAYTSRCAAVLAVPLVSLAWSVPASAAPVAFVQAAQSASDLSRVIRVVRGGKPLVVKGRYLDLEAGDEITLRSARAQAVVRYLGNNATHWVKRKAAAGKPSGPDYRVGAPRVESLPQAVFNWLVSQFVSNPAGRDTHEITASSRGRLPGAGCAGSDGPVTLIGIGGLPARLGGGNRNIVVQWAGGLAPYRVSIGKEGVEPVFAPATNGCSARLPASQLTPGRYAIELYDSNKPEAVPTAVEVIDALPAMPDALRDVALDQTARQLYYASWLKQVDGGVWALEAQQVALAQDCHDPAVREWLENAGLEPVCSVETSGPAKDVPGG